MEEDIKKLKQQAQEKIPGWVIEGEQYIYPEKYEEWEKTVIKCANELYFGQEIEASIEIMKALDNGLSINDVKQILLNQYQSNSSNKRVRNIVFLFSKKGPEFWKNTATKKINLKSRIAIIKQELLNSKMEKKQAQKEKMI